MIITVISTWPNIKIILDKLCKQYNLIVINILNIYSFILLTIYNNIPEGLIF